MRIFASVGLVLALTACGAASDAVDEVGETRTSSLHGTWRSEDGIERPAAITIEQQALSAKLTLTLVGHVCLAESTVETKVTLGGVETDAEIGGMRLELDGSPGLDEIVGNFEAIQGGPCPGQGGWLSVFR